MFFDVSLVRSVSSSSLLLLSDYVGRALGLNQELTRRDAKGVWAQQGPLEAPLRVLDEERHRLGDRFKSFQDFDVVSSAGCLKVLFFNDTAAAEIYTRTVRT